MNSKHNPNFPYHDCECKLSAEDIVHYGKIVVSLTETIRLMGVVDGVIESAALDGR